VDTAAPTEAAEASETRTKTHRWRVPRALVVTLLGIALLDVIAQLSTTSRAASATGAGSVSLAGGSDTHTYIYAKGFRRHSMICGKRDLPPVMECDALWGDPGLDVWALHLNRRTWAAGTESVRVAHYYWYAKRQRPGLWKVHQGVQPGSLGSVRSHTRTRWDIYLNGRMIGYTNGPQGVAAGLLWLTNPAAK
jgi:hypothetical protein